MKRLIIVDVSSFIFRAFYAIRSLTSPEGTPVNAVYGVFNMMIKLIDQYEPSHVLIARDTKGGSFRNEMYDAYKANRGAPPEELIPQFAIIEELIDKMQLPQVQIINYEADDIIGSAAVQYQNDFDEILIASGDKDLMQFVNDKVHMLDTMKDKIFGPKEVEEKMGVRPDQIVDYLSLLGDASDNIPGVKGIGAKGAAKLLAEFGTLEECFNHAEEMTNKRVKTGLTEYKEDGLLSKKLIQIVTDLELGKTSDELEIDFEAHPELVEFARGLGFNNSVKKLMKLFPHDDSGEARGNDGSIEKIETESKSLDKKSIKILLDQPILGVHLDWTLLTKEFTGLSVSLGKETFLTSDEKLAKEFLEKYQGELVGLEIKEVISFLENDFSFKYFDLGVAHFLINPSMKHTLSFMVEEYFGDVITDEKDKTFEDDGAARAVYSLKLKEELLKKVKELELEEIYNSIDLPLIPVLASMESQGVSLDSDFYEKLDIEFSKILEEIKEEVAKVSGEEEINLKSPKQVGHLLFEILELPVIKKTKTGYSTDVEVLTTLDQTEDSPIPGMLLKFRELEKLSSTYLKALPKLISPVTDKIHTTFKQTNAATGRLSSDNPNLQNIPVRTENGRRLRKGFFAESGHKLIAADYSQVELRLLAHFSKDPIMLEAFKNDRDIHAQTAAEIFQVELSEVTREQRGSAKAINFGLMYGQSSFGLSKQLGISRKEAKEYITHYFTRFSKVKGYLDSLKELCEETGYAQTLHGRKRLLPDIHSQNRTVKAMAERVAINSPIQGTAADIIKLAMINIDKKLKDKKLKSKMILQVHDELIFQVPEAEVEQMNELIKDEMENVVSLDVPLKVDSGMGENWYELK